MPIVKQDKVKNLYIDMDGVLVGSSLAGKEYAEQYPKLVPYAKEFLYWAIDRFDCYWLTCWSEESIYESFPMFPKIVHCKWKRRKTEAIDFNESFIWLEDGITSEERAVLEGRGYIDSYVYVDPKDDKFLEKWKESMKVWRIK